MQTEHSIGVENKYSFLSGRALQNIAREKAEVHVSGLHVRIVSLHTGNFASIAERHSTKNMKSKPEDSQVSNKSRERVVKAHVLEWER